MDKGRCLHTPWVPSLHAPGGTALGTTLGLVGSSTVSQESVPIFRARFPECSHSIWQSSVVVKLTIAISQSRAQVGTLKWRMSHSQVWWCTQCYWGKKSLSLENPMAIYSGGVPYHRQEGFKKLSIPGNAREHIMWVPYLYLAWDFPSLYKSGCQLCWVGLNTLQNPPPACCMSKVSKKNLPTYILHYGTVHVSIPPELQIKPYKTQVQILASLCVI